MFQIEQQKSKNAGDNKRNESNNKSSGGNYYDIINEQNKAFNNQNMPAQMMVEEEEEKAVQRKPVQKQGDPEEEEEPIQGKAIQKQESQEEEELVQGKAIQKQDSTEEELVQGKAKGNVTNKQKNGNTIAKPSGSLTSMPEAVQAKMENSFGTSFQDVNIQQNDTSANHMGALAYTQGTDIHFAPGQYNPDTRNGQELLGHELTHVVQQKQGRVTETKQSKGVSVNDSPSLEQEADDMGRKAANGQVTGIGKIAPSGISETVQKKTPQEKIKEFQSKTYSQTNFSPSTGSGLFDVSLNPINGRLEVKVKVNMNYIDGSAASFTGLTGQSATWTDAEKTKWTNDFIALLEGRWGGKYHFINPSLPGVTAYVDVEIEEVTSDWHYQLNVTKIPKGDWKGSSISHYIDASGNALKQNNKHYGTLDSEDLSWSDKGTSEKQKGAVHEFGHMIGLGDEYADSRPGITHAALVRNALGKTLTEGSTNDIMSCGNSIEKQHYVTFLEALQTITSDSTWEFKP